jgi:hypothetical protein
MHRQAFFVLLSSSTHYCALFSPLFGHWLKLVLFSSGMKREADGEMSSPQKRFRSGDDITIRLLIPSKVSEDSSHEIGHVGLII